MKRTGIAVLLVYGIVGGTRPIEACSCLAPPPPQEALEQMDAVFTGVVEELREVVGGPHGDEAQQIEVTLVVHQTWKGVPLGRLVVRTAHHGALCGYEFEQGREYLIYAQACSYHELHASLCSRTAPIEAAADDLSALGPSQPTEGATVQPGWSE